MVRPYQKNNLFFNKTGNYVASTGYAQIRAYENSSFLYHLLHLNSFVAEVMNRCTGTSYPAINSSDLATIFIQIPVKEEQTKIANFLTALDDKSRLVEKQLNGTKQYKKGLLQQLFV
jgi:type I restriction enzyme, S subunit